MEKTISLQELYALVDEAIRTEKYHPADDKKKKEELTRLYKAEQELKLLATDGSSKAREFTKNKILFILSQMKDIINKNNISMIILQYHIDYFKNIYNENIWPDSDRPVDKEIGTYFQKYSISMYDSFDRKLLKLAQIVYQELYGYSILDELVFESEFNEVACNRYDYIWIQYKGIKRRIPNSNFKFKSEDYYRRIIENRITATALEEMNAGEPFINCTLKNGCRVTAVRPPLSRNYVVNIRLFTYKDTRSELRNKFMEQKMMKLIEILSGKGRRNIAIIGEQGSGKTTAADELIIKNLDKELSIGLAEYTHELNIAANYPEKNVVELQYGKEFEPTEITEMFFRFNRDVMIYGEVRNPSEAFEMIKAMLRQARGSLFTFHSSSVRRMIHDLRQLLMQTRFYTDYREAQFDVADAVDIVIQIKLDRSSGTRYVYRISEVTADESNMSFSIRDLLSFDMVNHKYIINKEGLSSAALNSCLEYEMTLEDVSIVKELFTIGPEEKELFEYMDQAVNYE